MKSLSECNYALSITFFSLSNIKCFLKTVPGKEKQKHRTTGQDRKLRDKPTHLWSPNL